MRLPTRLAEPVSRRALLATGLIAPLACRARAQVDDAAVLPAFRKAGDPDDSAAFFRAAATGKPVYLPAARGSGPGGRYLIGSGAHDQLPSGCTIFGDGMDRTVIARPERPGAPFIFHCDSGSADPARNRVGLTIRDLTLEDDVRRLGFSEYSYLVMLNGATDASFRRVAFRGFRGDGLHLGSGTVLGHERHNRRVTVSECVFDGVNANNRNAISVIDCDGLVIERSQFLNCTRYGDGSVGPGDPMDPRTGLGQPGPIDLEPNDDGFPIVRDVVIRDNLFRGGGGYAVCLNLRVNSRLRIAQRGIRITGNTIEDRDGGLITFGFAGDEAIRSGPDYDVELSANTVRRCRTPFILNGMRGLVMARNSFSDCAGRAEIGNVAGNARITLRDNSFVRCGAEEPGYALWVRTSDRLTLAGNTFEDCGIQSGRRFGVALALIKGRITNLTLDGNRFLSPRGRTTVAAMAFREAELDQSTAAVGPQQMDFAAPAVRQALGL